MKELRLKSLILTAIGLLLTVIASFVPNEFNLYVKFYLIYFILIILYLFINYLKLN